MQDDVPISGYPTTNYMWYTKVVIVILSISDELQASSCRTVTQVWFPSAVFPLDWMWFLCSNIIWFLHKAQNLHLAKFPYAFRSGVQEAAAMIYLKFMSE